MVIYVSSSIGTLSAFNSFSVICFAVLFIFPIVLFVEFLYVLVIFSLATFSYWSFSSLHKFLDLSAETSILLQVLISLMSFLSFFWKFFHVGLYADDGLAIVKNLSGHKIERKRKVIIKL